ncbi:ABC transporter ATP-binding protein [Streptobacillus canis]|uniref:ABC transporter ATP-binding protein n=1 Tax=Streptobacillus canis TaxID=2678686 RepID=UPI0012E28D60|nr:ABC transporter ATP-binding protein [Streptobacillus canis]
MISIKNLVKKYDEKIVLDDLNLEVKSGEIFGLLGHNGAGKSTTIKSIVSIVNPEEGEIYIDELSLKEYRNDIKKKISYVTDSPNIFLKLPVMSYLQFIGNIYEVENNLLEERIDKYKKIFRMDDAMYNIIEELSYGMRQKVFLIGSLITDSDIWILDEPMTGLDPEAAFNLKEIMKERKKQGKTIIFSTHVLEVAENICDRVGILNKGKLIFIGSMDELKALDYGENLEEIYLNLSKR